MRKEYWRCEVGPIGRSKVSDCGDLPMRTAVKAAFEKLCGEWPELCSSGWGHTTMVHEDMDGAIALLKRVQEYVVLENQDALKDDLQAFLERVK